jgi:hypothetical protein
MVFLFFLEKKSKAKKNKYSNILTLEFQLYINIYSLLSIKKIEPYQYLIEALTEKEEEKKYLY